ncbi:MAG: hypothetical protein ABL897_07225 [Hyphomicrobium sp.]
MRLSNLKTLLPLVMSVIAVGAAAVLAGAVPRAAAPLVVAANAAPVAGELFTPVAAVLRHPRCMNCHPRDDRPRQGDDRHPHLQNIVRGADNLGFVNARCTSCHRDENNNYSGVPGAPNWHLAPLSMGWQGLGDAELCSTLKDETKNGGKDIAALVKHMEDDKLVLWGWQPGGTRTPVPTPHPKFMTELKAWAAAGAPCPTAAH